MRLLTFLVAFPVLLSAQNPKTPIYPGGTVTDKDTGVQVNRYTSNLTAALTASATTVSLASTTGLVNFVYLGIDSEFMMVCAVSGTTVTIGKSSCPNVDGRGLDGTTAAAHASGAVTAAYLVAGQFNQLAAEIKSMQANPPAGGGSIAPTTSALKGNGTGGGIAVTGTPANCVHVDGTSGSCGGATVSATASALKGDSAGNAIAVTGTGTNCVHVDGTSGACTAPLGNPYTNMHTGATTYALPEPCITVVSTVATDFTTGTVQQVRLFTAPAFWSPRLFRIEETTTVTAAGTAGGAAISALAASIGSATASAGYVTAFPLMGASSPAFREVSGGLSLAATAGGTQDVFLQLANTSNNPVGTFANLTGGSITTRICGVVLQ